MTFYVVWIHNNKRNIEKIWEQAKKVDSEEAVRESVASYTVGYYYWLVWLRKLRQFDLFSYK